MTNPTSGSVATYVIKVAGSAIPDTYQVQNIQIEQAINRISTAVVTFVDGDPSAESFAISASATFVPGAEITIELGYESKNTVVFSGIVTKQTIRVSHSDGPLLAVECKDKAIKMTVGRKSAGFSKTTDSKVITTLIGNAAGVTANVTSTSAQLEELVQYYTTDWDFMLARAEVNSMVVSTINNKLSVFDPSTSTASVFTITYGVNLYTFDADLDAVSQLPKVTASAWDYGTQQLINASASNSLAGPGNLSSKKLAEVLGLTEFDLQTTGSETKDDLTAWAKAQMLKSELAKITGEASFQGNADVVPGKYVTLAGLGARFNGDHFVSAVRHLVSEDENWITEIEIGLSANWFVEEHQVVAPPAAGLLPGIQGLYNATVLKIDSDPDNEYRIQVEVALFNDKGTGLWARLANFYSTNGFGVFFLPEVGDEVILGFLNQDPRYPVILGSVYSKKNKPFSIFTPNAKNSIKGIVTKAELQIEFDDGNTALSLITKNKNTIVLDDKNKQIKISDQNNNVITMSSSGIEIKSPKNITLEADQTVTIKGTNGVNIQASGGTVATKGMNITETADTQYSAKGNATASVQGGAELTLKAAMVMIN